MDSSTQHAECDCHVAQVQWRQEDARFDEHQAVVPGTCTSCGADLEYVYNEAGVREKDGEYIHEF